MTQSETNQPSREQAPATGRRVRNLIASLTELTAALCATTSEQAALQQLVARARVLLDADLAFTTQVTRTPPTVFDPGAHPTPERVRITATDGAWSPEFRSIEAPITYGLTGKMFGRGGPVQSDDYLADESFEHSVSGDAGFEAERIFTVLAVPLVREGAFIGALFVANRTPDPFSTDLVLTLQSLADIAGASLGVIERNAAALVELHEARAQAAAANLALATERRMAVARDALITAVGGGDLTELRAELTAALGRPLQVVDLTVEIDLRDEAAAIGDTERPLIALSAKLGKPVYGHREDGSAVVVISAVDDEHTIGALIARADRYLDERDREQDDLVLEQCARVLGAFLSAQSRERGDLKRRRQDTLADVLAPPPGGLGDAARARLASYGVREGEPFRILIADGSESARLAFEHRLELDFGVSLLRGIFDGRMVAIVPERAFTHLEESMRAAGARRHGNLLVGYSPKLHPLGIVPEEYALLLRVVQAARSSRYPHTLVSLDTFGALGAFLSQVTIEPTKRAVTQVLGPLLTYDALHDTELLKTARAFLDAGHSVAQAARALHVHENTVRQRLDRIAGLLGNGWHEGSRGLDMHLMLTAHQLIGADAA